MKRMSPPTGVQARPVATPGMLVRIAISLSKRGWPRIVGDLLRGEHDPVRAAVRDLDGDVAERLADLALQISNARLPAYIP